MRPGSALLSLALAAFAPAAAPAQPPAPVRVVPHRAVYDLSLAGSVGTSRGIDSAHGRIAFDFGGDACEGYTLKYRQVTVLESGESGRRTLDVRTATYESGDGKTIRFKTDSRFEGGSQDNIDGDAELRGDSLTVRLKEPTRETLTLPGNVIFPTEHLKRLIEAGRVGQTTVSVKVYDGSDDGKKVYDTLALIGRRIEAGAGTNLEEPAKREPLMKLPRWPVSISYFKAATGDQTPAYTISFELYENGISRALKLDYGDFALKGDLASLDILPLSACER
jgi:hypothetical protein